MSFDLFLSANVFNAFHKFGKLLGPVYMEVGDLR